METKLVTMTAEEFSKWKTWIEEQQERMERRGKWWLTPAGRAEIEKTWGPDAYNDGNCVRPIYDALVEAEQSLANSQEQIQQSDALISDLERSHTLALANFQEQVRQRDIVLNDLADAHREQTKLQRRLEDMEREELETRKVIHKIRLDYGARDNESLNTFVGRLYKTVNDLYMENTRLLNENRDMVTILSAQRAELSFLRPEAKNEKSPETNPVAPTTQEKEQISCKTPPEEISRFEEQHKFDLLRIDELTTDCANLLLQVQNLRGNTQGLMEEMARKDEKISRLELELEQWDPAQNLTHPELKLHIDRQAFKLMAAIVFGHLRQITPWDGENDWNEYIAARWHEARHQALVGWNLLTHLDGEEHADGIR